MLNDPKIIAINLVKNSYPLFDEDLTLSSAIITYSTVFRLACVKNELQIVEALLSLTEGNFKEQMIHENNDFVFTEIAAHNCLEMLDKVLNLIEDTEKREIMIHAQNDAPFIYAAANGHLRVIDRLLDLTKDSVKREQMIHTVSDSAFIYAAKNGHFLVLEKLLDLTQDAIKRDNMIHILNNLPFIEAAKNGHFLVLDKLLKLTNDPIKREDMIHEGEDVAFKQAAGNKQLLVVEYLCSFIHQDKYETVYYNMQNFIDPIYLNKKFINLTLAKIDKNFIQFLSNNRTKNPQISDNKIFSVIKFSAAITKFMEIGFNRLAKSFSTSVEFSGPAIDRILYYLDDKSSILNDLDRKDIHTIMESINKQAIESKVKQENNKSKKTSFVEKYIQQTKISKNTRALT